MHIFTLVFTLISTLFASSPTYIIPGSGSQNSLDKSSSKDQFRFTTDTHKSAVQEVQEMKVKEVHLNGQKFKIEIQEAFDSDGVVPFFQVAFPKGEVNHQLYALLGSQGTSGSQYHYFFRKPDGLFVYSGLHPEIIFDNKTKGFVSYEKDGPGLYETTWIVQDYHFVSTALKRVN